MNKLITACIASLVLVAIASTASAADTGKSKEKTITGEAKCAKCALKESDKCQTVIQTENTKGKTVTYWLANNDVAKNFHENVCSGPKKVVATGTLKKVDGKQQLTASKIEMANK